jgi:hypothetical protein
MLMSLEERAHLEQLLGMHTRNVHELEAQLASFSIQKPLHLLNELEYERTCIEAIQRQLRPHDAPRPPSGDLQFVNQIEALNAVLNQPQANNFVIDAPAGYGKTRLLRELAIRLAQASWYIRTVSFSDSHIKPMSQNDAVSFIAQHFNVKHVGSAEDTGRRVAQILRQLNANKNISKDSQMGSVLILDAIEQISTGTHLRSYDELKSFLHGLREGSSVFQNYTLRIILAGRYIGQYISISGDSIVINLKPFDINVIRQAISTFFESQQSEMSFERCGELAQHILYITGGHPEMVKKLLMDESIGIVQHQTIDLRKWRTDYLDDIRQKIVEPVIENIRGDLPGKLWAAIEVLCVYRRIYRYIIKQLLAQEISGYTTHFELIDDLKKARLIKHTGSSFEDGILRPAMVRWLQFSAPERFTRYCRIAHDILIAQLQNPAEGMTRAYVLKELLYIAVIEQYQIALTSDEELRRAHVQAIGATMAQHIRALLSNGLDRDGLEDLFDDLLNSLRADAELAFLFDYTFGAIQPYAAFVSNMCDIAAFGGQI